MCERSLDRHTWVGCFQSFAITRNSVKNDAGGMPRHVEEWSGQAPACKHPGSEAPETWRTRHAALLSPAAAPALPGRVRVLCVRLSWCSVRFQPTAFFNRFPFFNPP